MLGPVLSKNAVRRLDNMPKELFDLKNTEAMDGNGYLNQKLHQAYHHYIKVHFDVWCLVTFFVFLHYWFLILSYPTTHTDVSLYALICILSHHQSSPSLFLNLLLIYFNFPLTPTGCIHESPALQCQRVYPRLPDGPILTNYERTYTSIWSSPFYITALVVFFYLFLFSLLTLQYTSNFIPSYSLFRTFQYIDEEVPEARFSYDLSPMAVLIKKKGKKWYEFVTSMCALIGGTFTVVGLLSSFLNLVFKNKKI